MRDPERIPLILAAIEREWRQSPDLRLGQLIVNLLRSNRNVSRKDEGRVLFNVEDGELLRWIGPETAAERRYVQDEPRLRSSGWHRGPHEGIQDLG